jgi:hypothetical protein
VRADQVQLQRIELVLLDALVCELAEAGVHAVDSSLAVGGTLHDLCAGFDPRCSGGIDRQLHAAGMDGLDVVQRQLAGFEFQRLAHARNIGKFSPCSRAQAMASS